MMQLHAVSAGPGVEATRAIPLPAVPRAAARRRRRRVRKEVFRGAENSGGHRRGSELAALAVLTFAVACYAVYLRWTGFATGLLLGGLEARGGGGAGLRKAERGAAGRAAGGVAAFAAATAFAMAPAARVGRRPASGSADARRLFTRCPPAAPLATGVAGAWIGVTIQHW
jgi:hypothetical protein